MKQHPRGGTAAAENTRLSTSDGRSHLSSCPASGRSQETLDRAGSPAAPLSCLLPAGRPRPRAGSGGGGASTPLGSADVRRRREARPSPTPGPHRGAAGHGTAPPASPRPLHAPLRVRPGGRHSLLPLRPLKAVTAGTAGTAAREPSLAALLSRERGGARPSPWQPPPGLRRSAGRGGTGRDGAGGGGQHWLFVAFLVLYSCCGGTNFALKITGWGKKWKEGEKKKIGFCEPADFNRHLTLPESCKAKQD